MSGAALPPPVPGGSPEPGPLPSSPYGLARETTLLDRLNVVYRHRRIAVSLVLLTLIIGAVQAYSTPPRYSAQARLLIQDERSIAVAAFDANDPIFWQDPEPYYQTQYRILQSRGLARRVVRKMALVDSPEFNPPAAPAGGFRDAVASVRSAIARPIRALFSRDAPIAPAAPDETEAESAIVNALLSRVRVEPVRGTRLVDVSVVGGSPRFVAAAVNTLAEEYVAQNLELRLDAVQKTLVWLTEEIARQQAKVQQSERELAEYREAQDALSLEDRQNIVVARLNRLNDEVTRANAMRVQKEAAYRQMIARGDDPAAVEGVPAVAGNPTVQQLRARLQEAQRERTRLSERYGEKHPEIVRVNASIQDLTGQLRGQVAAVLDTVRNEYQSAVLEERTLVGALEAQKTAAMDLNRKNIDYSIIERESQSNRQVYEQLLQRDKELRVVSNSRANNVQLIDRAEEPKAPFAPNPRRTLLMALVLGLALGVGCAFALDYIDDTVRTPEDVTRKLKLPFLGLIPAVRGNDSPMLSGPVPHEFGEAFRALRTSLVFTASVERTRIILVTSAQPFEGKTTTSCNLALALAIGGARVLLVEGDMRRPGLHRNMGLANTLGLSQLLSGQIRVREGIQRTQNPNLFVITAGQIPPNPSELLASERMKQFLTSLATGPFDWVILDTPPVLAVTDPVVLVPAASGVVFVLGAEMTPVRLAERAIETLMAGNPRGLGVVLNRVDFSRDKLYYSRYYGYQHKSYYGRATAHA